MDIPSKKDCFALIKRMKMMDHIINHSVMVSNIAMFLTLSLKKYAPNLNVRLATSAALLHDITKTRSFDTHEVHSETGGQMLTALGYPEVGDIIRQHVILDAFEGDTPVSEQEIVNYSDKRVLHDKIVPLTERLEYIRIRYGTKKKYKNKIKRMWATTIKLEDKIFCCLDIRPDQLSKCIPLKIKREDYL